MIWLKWGLVWLVVVWQCCCHAGATESWPPGVQLIKAGETEFQVRSLGKKNSGPAVVLLSGPNQHWHSDSGWFALLQPVLASKYRTYAIDRLGQGLSSDTTDPSYRRFAGDLASVLAKLQEQHILLVSFASASISTLLFAHQNTEFRIQGLLLIDPDIPLPGSVALYKAYPADWYKANLAKLLPALKTGVWTERTAKKLQQERELVHKLLPADYASQMDWVYFDFMAQQRLRLERQQSRAQEIAAYAEDLDRYRQLPLYRQRPVSVVNSDFEQAMLQQNPEQKQQVMLWQQEGDDWSKQQVTASAGRYIELKNADHLVLFQHPAVLLKAVEWLINQPAE